jgi:tetratricopeptide (TPR) repeat protein
MREMGDYERAEELVLESLRLAEEIGEVWQKAYCLMTLGCTLAAHGDLDRAEPELRQALELTRRLGDRQTEAVILCHMAEAARKGKKLPEARARYEQSLAIRSDLGEAAGYALCRVGLAEVAADAEDWVGTAREMALAEQTPGSITGAEIERRMRALRARIARAGASKRTNVKF